MITIRFHKPGMDGFTVNHDMIEVPRKGDQIKLDQATYSFDIHSVEWHPNRDEGFEVYVVLR